MYELISFDMDGTLLTPEKTITPVTAEAVHRAALAGKTVVLCTGRSVAELTDYLGLLPDVRYAVCVSGGLIYDLKEKKKLYLGTMAPETVLAAMSLAEPEDPMIQFLDTDIYLQEDKCRNADAYYMGWCQKTYEEKGILVKDIRAFYRSAPFPVAKMNLYHRDTDARRRTRARLEAAGLPVVIKDSEVTSLELSSEHVNKGEGLRWLCGFLGIPLSRTIAAGDAANDLDVLMTAGLPAAMGNAWPEIKEAVLKKGGVIVPDNAHDGCADLICRYLLDSCS